MLACVTSGACTEFGSIVMTIGAELRPAIIGPFGPAQLACLRSWIGLGCLQYLCRSKRAIGLTRPALKLAAHVSFTRSELATQAGSSRLMRFLRYRAGQRDYLPFRRYGDMASNASRPAMPTGTEVLAARYARYPIPLVFLASKSAQAELAREVGFGTLPTYFISSTAQAVVCQTNVSFPLVARPDGPGRSAIPLVQGRVRFRVIAAISTSS